MFQPPEGLCLRLFQTVPEGRAQIGVKGEDAPGLLCDVHSLFRSRAHSLMCHGQRPEVKDPGVPDRILRDLILRKHHVCPGISVK